MRWTNSVAPGAEKVHLIASPVHRPACIPAQWSGNEALRRRQSELAIAQHWKLSARLGYECEVDVDRQHFFLNTGFGNHTPPRVDHHAVPGQLNAFLHADLITADQKHLVFDRSRLREHEPVLDIRSDQLAM